MAHWEVIKEAGELKARERAQEALIAEKARELLDAKGMVLPVVRNTDFSSWGGWTRYEFDQHAMTSYARGHVNSAIMQLVTLWCLSFSDAPLWVYKRSASGQQDQPLLTDPLFELFDMPNEWMSSADFWALIMQYMQFGGNAYAHIVRADDKKTPIELYPYSDGQMFPVTRNENWIDHYRAINPDGTIADKPIPREDVIHFTWPTRSMTFPMMGQSPLVQVLRHVLTDNEATRIKYQVLKNEGMVRGVLVDTKGMVTNASQAGVLEGSFHDKTSGERAGEVVVLRGGLDYKRIALSLAELDLSALNRLDEDRMAGAFLIPTIYSGLTAGAAATTYDNLSGARQFFFEDRVTKMWRNAAATASRKLLVRGDKRYFWFYTNDVVALRKDVNAISGRVVNQWQTGIMKRSEARSALDLPVLDDDADGFYNELMMPQGAMPPAPPGGTPTAGELSAGTQGQKVGGSEDAELKAAAYWKSYDDPATAFTGKLEKAVGAAFEALLPKVLKRIPGKSRSKDREDWTPFEIAEFEAILAAQTEKMIKDYIADTLERAVIEVGANWGAIESEFDVAIRKTLKGSTDLIKQTCPTVKAELQKLLSDNFEASADELAGLIRSRFEDIYSVSRANLIARTTATYSTTASQLEAWTHLDTEYSWLSQRNGTVRPDHASADGQRPDKDGFFTVGGHRGRHPGAMGSADQDCNCQCVLRARPKEE